MKIVADLHIHSYYSRATSKNLNFEHLYKWAQLKGVNVVGTGDIAHPGWLTEMREKLEPAEEGLFRLKAEIAREMDQEIPVACRGEVRFMLAGEISNIYKKYDRVRKIHNVVFLPSLDAVEKLQRRLEKIGNIRSDGRPILGLDARDLFEIVLETDPAAHLIPAHIWTPWFSLFGSKSGFDRIEDCFNDLTPHIFALETGLSSDPPMNWRWSALDNYTLVSNSDAHSPQKLAREATLFETDLSYPAMFAAMQSGDPKTFRGTLEFFPQEGKYHHDGHRKCGTNWTPKTTVAHDMRCLRCGKPVTVGVMHRIETLADRAEGERPEKIAPFHSLIPLPEVLSEIYDVGPNSKRVQKAYLSLLGKLGSELYILQDAPLEDLARDGGARLAEGIRRMRNCEVRPIAGYDGEFGVIKLFEKGEPAIYASQLDLFPARGKTAAPGTDKNGDVPATEKTPVAEVKDPSVDKKCGSPLTASNETDGDDLLAGLNPEQRDAVFCVDRPLLVMAGPGTGKTRTLTHRIAYLIREKTVAPENILAITFTNKAAGEMAERIDALCGTEIAGRVTINTFHGFGAMVLRESGKNIGVEPGFAILDSLTQKRFLAKLFPDYKTRKLQRLAKNISEAKNVLLASGEGESGKSVLSDDAFLKDYQAYEKALRSYQLVDYDDLLLQPVKLYSRFPEVLAAYQQRYRWISIDEYQDINASQYALVRMLNTELINFCAIGDADQAIYGFRGADRSYFLRYQEDFPKTAKVQLTRNYRSNRNIVQAAGQVISRGDDSSGLPLISDIVSKKLIEFHVASTGKAEAEFVVHQIEQRIGGTSHFSMDSGRAGGEEKNRGFSDFAVLYRLNRQVDDLVEAFERSGIPYQTTERISFFEHPVIQQVLAYLWFAWNPQSLFHLENIYQEGNADGQPAEFLQIAEMAKNNDSSNWDVLLSFRETDAFNDSQKAWLSKFIPLISEIRTGIQQEAVAGFIQKILMFMQLQLSVTWPEEDRQLLDQLIVMAGEYMFDLQGFLQNTALQREGDAYDPRADRVSLMTLHASKGLEFPVVFMLGCEEGVLPFARRGMKSDLEEERRLFYVGMTRAKDNLILSRAGKRQLDKRKMENASSRFLADIELALQAQLATDKPKKVVLRKEKQNQLKLF